MICKRSYQKLKAPISDLHGRVSAECYKKCYTNRRGSPREEAKKMSARRKSVPFSVFKRKNSGFYYVRFRDETTGKYLTPVSTRQSEEREAVRTAWAWYSQGKAGGQDLKTLSLLGEIRRGDISGGDAVKILEILKERGLIRSYVMAGARNDVPLSDYLLDFWNWERSEYIQDRLRAGRDVGRTHIKENVSRIMNFWIPFFKGRLLGEITRQDLKDFSAALQRKDMASSTKNKIWLAGARPLRHAYQNELIDRDITAGIPGFHGGAVRREILTPEIAQALFSAEWKDARARLANMLAMLTGMRSGEIRALRKRDLGGGCVYVRHSWSDTEGLKSTKNGEERTVQLPFPNVARALLELAESNPYDSSMDAFVFYATIPGKPVEAHVFIDGLRAALERVGLSPESAGKYCFHAWRHFYASYMRDRISARLLQSQTGHKTTAMLEHYSNHRISGDDEQIQQAQIELFGGIVDGASITFDERRLYQNVKTKYMDKSGLYEHSRQLRK